MYYILYIIHYTLHILHIIYILDYILPSPSNQAVDWPVLDRHSNQNVFFCRYNEQISMFLLTLISLFFSLVNVITPAGSPNPSTSASPSPTQSPRASTSPKQGFPQPCHVHFQACTGLTSAWSAMISQKVFFRLFWSFTVLLLIISTASQAISPSPSPSPVGVHLNALHTRPSVHFWFLFVVYRGLHHTVHLHCGSLVPAMTD